MKNYSVKIYQESDYKHWNAFMDKAKNATFLFHRDFMEYHKDRFQDYSVIVLDGEKWVAVLPANRVENEVFSHQGLTYGGLIYDEKIKLASVIEMFKSVLSFLNENNIEKLQLKLILSIYHQKPAEERVNSRLDELQAAFLNVKLPNLDAENNSRRAIANLYLSNIKNNKITLPTVLLRGVASYEAKQSHVFHLFVIRTENRLKLQKYLFENEIETMIHYPIPPHKQKTFSNWNNLSFPLTEMIHNEVFSLLIGPLLTMEEVDFIVEILNCY